MKAKDNVFCGDYTNITNRDLLAIVAMCKFLEGGLEAAKQGKAVALSTIAGDAYEMADEMIKESEK